MSLLIKALEQAARDRKAGRADVQPASAPAGAAHEPTLEPPPPPRAPPARASADATAQPAAAPEPLSLDAAAPASPPPRRVPTSLTSLNTSDTAERARAAAVMQAGENSRSSEVIAYLRGNPVALFGGLAVLFGIGFGIYVYIQVAHPGLFVRQIASRPQEPAPAPPLPATPPGLADVAGPDPTRPAPPPFDPVLAAAPDGASAAGGSTAGSIGPASAPKALDPAPPPAPAPAQLPVASSAVLDRPPVLESQSQQRAPTSEVRAERGSIRPAEPERLTAAPPRTPLQAQAPSTAPSGPPAVRPAPAPAAEPARERIAVSPTGAQPRLNPSLSQGYALLQSGDTAAARALYDQAIQEEPLNIDALLGSAYLAAQENRSEDATRLYLRILQLNPRHAVAQAALIGLMGRADPAASESRLKQLIAREPTPFLHFVLGNLYADQGLWSQAQSAYFQAHALEPANPDYAYNLAVGLDHLRQEKLALDFYRRAEQLSAAQGRSNFSVPHARERIRILSSQAQ